MKCVFAVFGAFMLVNMVQSMDMKFWSEMVECANSMGISEDQMKDMMAAKDEKLGCINACVMKKLGVMSDGKIHLDNLVAILDKHKDEIPNLDKVKGDTHACYDEATSGGDLPECQSAGKFAMCMHEHMQG